MTLALSADSMEAMLRSLTKQDETINDLADAKLTLEEIQTHIVVDKHRQDVLHFFVGYNPQPNLETSIRLRHLSTGLWFTEGDDFKDWLGSRNGRLWLSGIPGAGKTVLAGAMIQECLAATQHPGSTRGCCFFFCDYKEEKSQSEKNIKGCLASQLARQSNNAFDILAGYYTDLHPNNGLPKPSAPVGLTKKLVEMSQTFYQVLLVVDGLDECGPNSGVTKCLAGLADQAPSISIALLSRAEQHIRSALGKKFHHIERAAQSADIQMYVRSELKRRIKDGELRIRRPSLEAEIIQTLIDGAQGMQ